MQRCRLCLILGRIIRISGSKYPDSIEMLLRLGYRTTNIRLYILPDIQPDILPDIQPDILPDIRLYIWPDIRSDILPDIRSDILPETRPDILPGIRSDILPDIRPDILPDIRPDILSDKRPNIFDEYSDNLIHIWPYRIEPDIRILEWLTYKPGHTDDGHEDPLQPVDGLQYMILLSYISKDCYSRTSLRILCTLVLLSI